MRSKRTIVITLAAGLLFGIPASAAAGGPVERIVDRHHKTEIVEVVTDDVCGDVGGGLGLRSGVFRMVETGHTQITDFGDRFQVIDVENGTFSYDFDDPSIPDVSGYRYTSPLKFRGQQERGLALHADRPRAPARPPRRDHRLGALAHQLEGRRAVHRALFLQGHRMPVTTADPLVYVPGGGRARPAHPSSTSVTGARDVRLTGMTDMSETTTMEDIPAALERPRIGGRADGRRNRDLRRHWSRMVFVALFAVGVAACAGVRQAPTRAPRLGPLSPMTSTRRHSARPGRPCSLRSAIRTRPKAPCSARRSMKRSPPRTAQRPSGWLPRPPLDSSQAGGMPGSPPRGRRRRRRWPSSTACSWRSRR